MLTLLLFGGGGTATAVTEVPADKGQDAGSGWWEGEWINPDEVYGSPLKPKIEKVKVRVKALKKQAPKQELAPVVIETANLSRSISALEKKINKARTEASIEEAKEKYRELLSRHTALERMVVGFELEVRRKRIHAEDEEIIRMVQRLF